MIREKIAFDDLGDKENKNGKITSINSEAKSMDGLDLPSLASEVPKNDHSNSNAKPLSIHPFGTSSTNTNTLSTPKSQNIYRNEFTPILRTLKKQDKGYVPSPLSKAISPRSPSDSTISSIQDPAFQLENDLQKTIASSISVEKELSNLETSAIGGHNVKQEEDILNKLMSENFNLKLRVHFLNKVALEKGLDKDDEIFKKVDFEVIKGNLIKDCKKARMEILETKKALLEQQRNSDTIISKKDADIDILKTEIESLKAKLDFVKDENPIDTSNIEAIEDLQGEIRRIKDINEELEQQNADLKHDLKVQKENYLDDNIDKIDLLQEEIKEKDKNITELENKISELNHVIDQCVLDFKEAADMKISLQLSNDDLRAELENLLAKQSRLSDNAQNDGLTNQLEEKIRELKNDRESLMEELRSLKNQQDLYHRDSEDLLQKISDLQNEKAKLKADLERFVEEAGTSPTKNVTNQNISRDFLQNKKIRQAELQNLDLESKLRRVEQEKKNLCQKLDLMEKENYERMALLRENLDSAKAQVSRLDRKSKETNTAYHDALNEIMQLKEQLTSRTSDMRIYNELRDIEQKNKLLQQEVNSLQSLLRNTNTLGHNDMAESIKELESQVIHLRKIALRERSYRIDLIFAKAYFMRSIEMYDATNEVGIDLMEKIGLKPEEKLWRRRKSLRSVVFLVIAVNRLRH